MARIRTIKPDFYRHEGLQDLEAANPGKYCMLVFSALWGHCDKAGRFEWRPRTLKLDILPFLAFDMADTLAALCEAGFVTKYEVDSKEYGLIKSFQEHQRINGKEAQEQEKYPKPPENKQGSNWEATGKHLPGQEGKGREGNGVHRAHQGGLDGFAEFWAAYPKKIGKGAAEKAFFKAGINGHLPDILKAIERARATEQWQKDRGQFIPHPATWLNQRRWEDEPPLPADLKATELSL